MRLIDSNALIKEANEDGAYGYVDAFQIANAPTIDAVPVVRCHKCIYFEDSKMNEKGFLICPASGMEITGMDFCSYGEPKEGAE